MPIEHRTKILAQLGRQWIARVRKIGQRLRFLHDPFDRPLRGFRIILRNVLINLDQPTTRFKRSDHFRQA
jgi:hypothetical protein